MEKNNIVHKRATLKDGIIVSGTHPKVGTITMDENTKFLYSESLNKCFPTEGIFTSCGFDPDFFNITEELVLLGVFSEFDTRTKNRPYVEEDYLPHIEELKKKIKEKTNSKFVSAKEYNDLIESLEEIVKKLDTAIAYAEYIANKGNELNDRIEALENKGYYLERLCNGEYVLSCSDF